MVKAVLKEINGVLDSALKHLEVEEAKTIKRDNSGRIDKNKQEIQYYFIKIIQDDAKTRKLCCRYQAAMLDDKKAINDFENIEESVISPLDQNDPAGTQQFDHEDLEELGFNLNKE